MLDVQSEDTYRYQISPTAIIQQPQRRDMARMVLLADASQSADGFMRSIDDGTLPEQSPPFSSTSAA